MPNRLLQKPTSELNINPFLKWPGGKRRSLDLIRSMLPHGRRFIEPFVGSGVVYLNTKYPQKIVADRNPDLINLYHQLIKEKDGFIDFTRRFFTEENNCKRKYIEYRDLFNSTKDIRLKSALFVYLNKHGFNGLCRYNQNGIYNVPFGNIKTLKAYFPEKEMISFFELSKNISIRVCDFRELFNEVQAGDVLYCDPPYVPLSDTARLTQYSPFKFDLSDHEDLAACAKKASGLGAKVLISNHDTEFTREIYSGAEIKSLNVQRQISCNARSRVKVKELMAFFE